MHQEDDDADKSEGFWKEFFLLKPDRKALRTILNNIRPSDILLFEAQTQELFARAIAALKSGHASAPSNALDVRGFDKLARNRANDMAKKRQLTNHSCQTLSVFLSSVLSKKYSHSSSAIITVLAGLDHIDSVFTDFVGTLDGIIRNGKSRKTLTPARTKHGTHGLTVSPQWNCGTRP